METNKICIIGSGPTGCFLALMLVKRGFKVEILEKRAQLEDSLKNQGRSINLILCIKGISALEKMGLTDLLETGKMVKGCSMYNPAGEHLPHYIIDNCEIDYSINRNLYNLRILEEVRKNPNINIRFESTVFEINSQTTTLKFYDTEDKIHIEKYIAIFGADGVHSTMKKAMMSYWGVTYNQSYSQTQYIELVVPADENGQPKLAVDMNHMWPRKGFEMVGFPNIDNTVSLNLFMLKEKFEELSDNKAFLDFFNSQFGNIQDKVPDLEDQIARRKIGYLLESDIYPWSVGNCCLIGDSAHSMLPYFGQGYNTTLEDCMCLDSFLDQYDNNFEKAFQSLQQIQHPNGVAAQKLTSWFFDQITKPEEFFKYRVVSDYLREIYPSKFKAINHLIIHSRVQQTKVMKLIDIEKELLSELHGQISNIIEIALAKQPNNEVEEILNKYAHHYQDAWNNPIDYRINESKNEKVFDTTKNFKEE